MLRDFGRSPLMSPDHETHQSGVNQNTFTAAVHNEKPNVTKFFENNVEIDDPSKAGFANIVEQEIKSNINKE